MDDDYEVMGVYSHSIKYEYKAGERESRYRHGTFWFVRKRNDNLYEVRPLNANHLPSGLTKLISKEDFLKLYTPELSYYQDNTLPCLETLQKKVRLGRRYFNLGHMEKAELEFCEAVLMQEDCVDGNMGLSEVYSEQQKFSELRTVLDKMLNIDEVFREEQRHRFNEFGINLRKKELYDDAIRFYTKALEVNELDENLHFNIARAYHAKENFAECRNHLECSLKINPEMPEARSFMKVIDTEAVTMEKLKDKAVMGREAEAQARAAKQKKGADSMISNSYDLNF